MFASRRLVALLITSGAEHRIQQSPYAGIFTPAAGATPAGMNRERIATRSEPNCRRSASDSSSSYGLVEDLRA